MKTIVAKTIASLAALALGTAAFSAPLLGEVLEVRDAAPYTYLRLKTQEGETWAAVNAAPVTKGARVRVDNPIVMQNFQSKSLDKTFDKIVFGTLASANAPAAAAKPSPHGATGAVGASAPAAKTLAKVPKATGSDARTVAEIVSGKAALNGKSVSVRGQVVKANLGIMGKNWIHLQDGSGAAGDGSHDILVTTQDKAAVGDIVTVKGTVRTDVKLGAGYEYAVLIEDAALRK